MCLFYADKTLRRAVPDVGGLVAPGALTGDTGFIDGGELGPIDQRPVEVLLRFPFGALSSLFLLGSRMLSTGWLSSPRM